MKIRRELKPEDLLVVVDSREKLPLNLAPMRVETSSLTTGDYSVKGLEQKICVERKSLDDLTQSLGRERERFDREMHRILAYQNRCLVIEGTMQDVIEHKYTSQITPNAVLSSLMGYASHGIPFVFCGSRENMEDLVKRFLFISVRRIWDSHLPMVLGMLQSVAKLDNKPE